MSAPRIDMQRHHRKQLQRQHEEYWRRCWAVALGQRLNAQVQSNRPHQDPPNVNFRIRKDDGTENETWGEITGVYYDGDEAEWMWAAGPESQQGRTYFEPDAVVAAKAAEPVEGKRSKYFELVRHRGRGHLLVVLNHPLTTRLTRVAAERAIGKMLGGNPRESEPFEAVSVGYRAGYGTEDQQYVLRDDERSNFTKWRLDEAERLKKNPGLP